MLACEILVGDILFDSTRERRYYLVTKISSGDTYNGGGSPTMRFHGIDITDGVEKLVYITSSTWPVSYSVWRDGEKLFR